MRKKYALVRFCQIKNNTTKDNTILEMSLVDTAASKKALENKIADVYSDIKNDKCENYTILLAMRDEIKFISKEFKTLTTYIILEK